HPGLRSLDSHVSGHDRDLLADQGGRELEDVGDAGCVLGRDRGDGGGAVHAEEGERFQVRLDAGTATRVGARDRQRDRDLHALLNRRPVQSTLAAAPTLITPERSAPCSAAVNPSWKNRVPAHTLPKLSADLA